MVARPIDASVGGMTTTPRDGESGSRRSGLRVVWLSGSYGYSGRLLYFRDIFSEFVGRFPRTVIPVDRRFPAQDYPDLPLIPSFVFHRFERHRRVGGIEYRRVLRIPALTNLIRVIRLRPDAIIVVEFTPTSVLGFVSAWVTRTPILLLIESDPAFRQGSGGSSGTSRKAKAVLAVKRFLARRSDAVLVSNESGRRYVSESLQVGGAATVVGPYLTSAPARPSALPEDRGFAQLLFVNSLARRKGVAELLTALAALPAHLEMSWRLDVVGDGPERSALIEQAAELGLTDRVSFLGFSPYEELEEHYRNSDIVISPSLMDYRSLSGFEAVNAGRPLIVSQRDGAHHELVANAPGVRVVDPVDAVGFSEAIGLLIGERDSLRSEFDGSAPSDFSVAAIGQNLEDAVQLAVSRFDARRRKGRAL